MPRLALGASCGSLTVGAERMKATLESVVCGVARELPKGARRVHPPTGREILPCVYCLQVSLRIHKQSSVTGDGMVT